MHTIYHHIKNITLTTPRAIVLGACIIAVGIVSYGYIIQGATVQATVTHFLGKAVDTTDYVEGNPKSNVIVVEYSDPSCPFCIQLSPVMNKIHDDYKNKVLFVYRNFPLTTLHAKAFAESQAIWCSGKLGGSRVSPGFWAARRSDLARYRIPRTGSLGFYNPRRYRRGPPPRAHKPYRMLVRQSFGKLRNFRSSNRLPWFHFRFSARTFFRQP